jgi:hypothetical protein
MNHGLAWLLVVTALAVPADDARAQGALRGPLPSQFAAATDAPTPKAMLGEPPPFSSAGAVAQGTLSEKQAACMKEFSSLREDAQEKRKLIKEASDRHASPVEVCKIIASYGVAEVRMIKYMEANAAACEVPARITDQLRIGHRNTEALAKQVCTAAEQMKRRGPAVPTGLEEVLDPERGQPRGVISDFGDPAYGRIRRGF